jgi:hypothetical protein
MSEVAAQPGAVDERSDVFKSFDADPHRSSESTLQPVKGPPTRVLSQTTGSEGYLALIRGRSRKKDFDQMLNPSCAASAKAAKAADQRSSTSDGAQTSAPDPSPTGPAALSF